MVDREATIKTIVFDWCEAQFSKRYPPRHVSYIINYFEQKMKEATQSLCEVDNFDPDYLTICKHFERMSFHYFALGMDHDNPSAVSVTVEKVFNEYVSATSRSNEDPNSLVADFINTIELQEYDAPAKQNIIFGSFMELSEKFFRGKYKIKDSLSGHMKPEIFWFYFSDLESNVKEGLEQLNLRSTQVSASILRVLIDYKGKNNAVKWVLNDFLKCTSEDLKYLQDKVSKARNVESDLRRILDRLIVDDNS